MSDPGGGLVRHTRGTFVSPRGPALRSHAWQPTEANANAAAGASSCELFVLHGYGAHGAFPTVRLLASHLAARGFTVRSLDFEARRAPRARARARRPGSSARAHRSWIAAAHALR